MEIIDIVTSIGTIVGIVSGLYGAINSWRANKRLDENDGLSFNVRCHEDRDDVDWLYVSFCINNHLRDSIFVEEIRPLNFKKLIPEIGKVDEDCFLITAFGEPQSTYKYRLTEIPSEYKHVFEFKIPKDLKKMKLKIFYSYTTIKGLKKATRIYEYICSHS